MVSVCLSTPCSDAQWKMDLKEQALGSGKPMFASARQLAGKVVRPWARAFDSALGSDVRLNWQASCRGLSRRGTGICERLWRRPQRAQAGGPGH